MIPLGAWVGKVGNRKEPPFETPGVALTGDIGSAVGGTGLFPSAPSLDQNEH